MKIYLAARYGRRAELNLYRRDLESLGHVVTSRWLSGASKVERAIGDMPDADALSAQNDVEDVAAADLVISFTEKAHGRGGRHVEFGIALALNKRQILVGPRENVFHCLPTVIRFWTWQEACLYLIGECQ